ncbi:hypothetical protein [Exiguobacterium sp. s191]|uniref:hypothetical protein n=1 Tax=Exiguobacterium sp. s191 TaxID=2751196 RepID=UPI001BEC1584|nr:hypothetical protein [Exiguobacterium sp. s191]
MKIWLFFLAGDVGYWKTVLSRLDSVKEKITIDNIFEQDGPLKSILQSSIESIKSDNNPIIGAIGVFVDPDTNKNVTFQIKGKIGYGCNIDRILNDTCLAIGSGSQIPNIEMNVLNNASKYESTLKGDLYEIGKAVRQDLKGIFKRCGASSFEKLGISPVFAISTVEFSSFKMIGEEIKGSFYSSTNDKNIDYHYKYEMEEGVPTLFDCNSKVKIRIEDINNYEPSIKSILFDPEKLSDGFDPTEVYQPNTNIMYIVNQWKHGSMQDLQNMSEGEPYICKSECVERAFYRIEKFEYNGKVLCDPNYVKIGEAILDNISFPESQKFNNVGFYSLLLNNSIEEQQFESLIKYNIFEHSWIKDKISNYYGLYKD